jgi:hypothetical protein
MVSGRLGTMGSQKERNSPKITRRDRRFRNRKAAENGSAVCNVVGTGAQLETLHDTALFFQMTS